MDESGLFPVLYFINFQIRQIIATNQTTFSCIQPRTVVWVKISKRNNTNFPRLKSLYLFLGGQNDGAEIWAFDATGSISG